METLSIVGVKKIPECPSLLQGISVCCFFDDPVIENVQVAVLSRQQQV